MAGLADHGDDAAATASIIIKSKDSIATSEYLSESGPRLHEIDGIHDGLEFPTEEEGYTLRRVSDTVPWNAYLIAVVGLAERFSFYGSSVVFTNFIQKPLPPGSHTGLTNFYMFWCYVTHLLGAYIAYTYWGQFKTVCVAVVVAFIGHAILIISAVPGIIERQSAIGAFSVIALIIMGLDTGLFKANISPLVAEQYKRTKLFVITTKSGERVIVDPMLTVSQIYMYFYLFINIGALVGQISMIYSEKFVGFYLAYTLPTPVFFLCPIVLFIGRNKYAQSPPTGFVLGSALRLWRFAARGKWTWNPVRMYRNFKQPGFWENAKPSKQTPESKPAWMTFDDQWVDEVQRGIKAWSVFCWFPVYWLTYNQLNNNLTFQAADMSTHGLPNDVLSNLDPFALVILIPLCDILIYPAFRRMRLNFTSLKKITAGFITGTIAMIWAAVVQHFIYKGG